MGDDTGRARDAGAERRAAPGRGGATRRRVARQDDGARCHREVGHGKAWLRGPGQRAAWWGDGARLGVEGRPVARGQRRQKGDADVVIVSTTARRWTQDVVIHCLIATSIEI
ncbi:hypothetical protein GUJ93_ZPchr0008g11552 [Zizania palustris]|uniref:Uncharacterized protein n=1 Tax=Zizania palustris TaxID=103762 RepID=A0A8J5RK03_ZIZPA|nr:hypothetical protein GUJ93_ZPchr0008g11552 [Zizania palustris]